MAFLNDVSPAGPSLLARFRHWSAARRNAEARRLVYRQLLEEDDHRLTDLGVTRHDIARLLQEMDRR